MNTTVSEKGQVTIPKALRDRLGIRPGEEVAWTEERGRLIGVKVRPRDPLDDAYGLLSLDRGTDDVMSELRGEPHR